MRFRSIRLPHVESSGFRLWFHAATTNAFAVLLLALLSGTISQASDPVKLRISVTDKQGNTVQGLGREDFSIYEDGQIQTITGVTAANDIPLSVVLVMDASGSTRNYSLVAAPFEEFFKSTLRRGVDRGAVMSFSSDVFLTQEFTDDNSSLSAAIQKVISKPKVGTSALYDACLGAAKLLRSERERKAILVLSDGDDNSSRTTVEAMLKVIQMTDVTIYTMSVSNGSSSINPNSPPGESSRGTKIMSRIAGETGGRSFSPITLMDLERHLQAIRTDFRDQYVVSYIPSRSGKADAFRKIRVELANKINKPHYRAGYYLK